jgi:hypothetical protein
MRSIRPMCGGRLSAIMSLMSTPELVIRLARTDDLAAIERLAELDSARVPAGDVIVAEVRGAVWAALSLADFHAVADPFRPTAELVFLLAERGRQLLRHEQRSARRGRRFGRRRPLFA